MNDYGILDDNIGGISSGHKAFNLWDHGRGVLKNNANGRPFTEVRWVFEYPPVPNGEAVLMFLALDDDPNCRVNPMNTGNSSSQATSYQNNYSPYFYIYSTAIPEITNPSEREYGLEIFNEEGNTIYNSNNTTLRPIHNIRVPSGNLPIGGIDVAALVIWRSVSFDPGMNNYMGITKRFLKRVGNEITWQSIRQTVGVSHPQVMMQMLNDVYGSREKYSAYAALIDVTGIERK